MAERVMGWTNFSRIDPTCDFGVGRGGERNFALSPDGRTRLSIPLYSTDISAAWTVVEKMRERGVFLTLDDARHGNYRWPLPTTPFVGWWVTAGESRDDMLVEVRIGDWGLGAPTAPEAICRAALAVAANAESGAAPKESSSD